MIQLILQLKLTHSTTSARRLITMQSD